MYHKKSRNFPSNLSMFNVTKKKEQPIIGLYEEFPNQLCLKSNKSYVFSENLIFVHHGGGERNYVIKR